MNTLLDSDSVKEMSLVELVTYYRNIKPRLKNNEIYNDICNIHDRMLSPRQLKEICRIEKLTRKPEVSYYILRELMLNELSTSRSCLGYRQMTEFINMKYNLNVSKNKVR